MPVALRAFGAQLMRHTIAADLAFGRSLRSKVIGLEDSLRGVAARIVDDLYPTPDARMDVQKRKAKQRTYLGYARTHILDFYDALAPATEAHVKSGFMTAASQFRGVVAKLYPVKYVPRSESWGGLVEGYDGAELFTLSDLWVGRLVEKDEIKFDFGSGTVRDSYKDFIAGQLNRGTAPGSLIKTLAPKHVDAVQGSMIRMLDKGESLNWAKDEAFKKITGSVVDPTIRTKIESDIMRAVRTSYNAGVNADISNFSVLNHDLVDHLVRKADGRPCLACILLDNARYPVGSVLDEHPYGMCIFVPVLKTPSEMGLKVPKDIEDAAWRSQRREVPSLRDRFFAMSDKQKEKVFGNAQLFSLWKKERFPLDALVRRTKGGLIQVASSTYIEANLPVIGSISHPATVLSPTLRTDPTKLLRVLDPIDRSEARTLILDRVPDAPKTEIAKFDASSIDPKTPWWKYNDRARELGLYVRKGVDGTTYYSVPKSYKFSPSKGGDRSLFLKPTKANQVARATDMAPVGYMRTTMLDGKVYFVDDSGFPFVYKKVAVEGRDTLIRVPIGTKAVPANKIVVRNYTHYQSNFDLKLGAGSGKVVPPGGGVVPKKVGVLSKDKALPTPKKVPETPKSTKVKKEVPLTPGQKAAATKAAKKAGVVADAPASQYKFTPANQPRPKTGVGQYFGAKSPEVNDSIAKFEKVWSTSKGDLKSLTAPINEVGHGIAEHAYGSTRYTLDGEKYAKNKSIGLLRTKQPVKIQFGKITSEAYGYYDPIKDTVRLSDWHYNGMNGKAALRTLVHESTHAHGSMGSFLSPTEGFTELSNRIVQHRYGIGVGGGSYDALTDITARLSMVASDLDPTEAARFIRTFSIEVKTIEGGTAYTQAARGKIVDKMWSFKGMRTAFTSRDDLSAWYDSYIDLFNNNGSPTSPKALKDVRDKLTPMLAKKFKATKTKLMNTSEFIQVIGDAK